MRFMITLVLSLLPAAAASGQNIIYLHDGIDRQYRIHIPDGVPESAPLVLALHGYGGTNNGMMNNYGWVQLADERGFVVAFPNGTRDQWNSRFWDVGYDFHAGLDIDDDLNLDLQFRNNHTAEWFVQNYDFDPSATVGRIRLEKAVDKDGVVTQREVVQGPQGYEPGSSYTDKESRNRLTREFKITSKLISV